MDTPLPSPVWRTVPVTPDALGAPLPAPPAGEVRRARAAVRSTPQWLRVGGVLLWLAVGCDTLLTERALVQLSGRWALWGVGFALFGLAFAASSSAAGRKLSRWGLAAVGLESALALFLLGFSHNAETAFLLLLVTGQLALLGRRTLEIAVLAGQTLISGVLFLGIFPLVQALFLTALYGSFQLFAAVLLKSVQSGLRARRELLRAHAELRAARRLLAESSRLAERLRISRDLHDLLGHRLTALSLQLEVASHAASADLGDAAVRQAQELARRLLSDIRAAVHALREPAGPGLEGELAALAAEFPQLAFHREGLERAAELGADDPDRAQALRRAVQEIVTNAVRHAGAANLWIELERVPGGVEVRARDDGRGAAEWAPGHGLSGLAGRLAELGGTLAVATAAGQGFAVTAYLPTARPAAALGAA